MKKLFLLILTAIFVTSITAQVIYPIESDIIQIRKRSGADAILDVLGTLKVRTLPSGNSGNKVVVWDSTTKQFKSILQSSISSGGSGLDTSKVPYTGATRALNLGTRRLLVDTIQSNGSTIYLDGTVQSSADIKAGRRFDAGIANTENGAFRFYNSSNSFYTNLQNNPSSSNITVLMPNSSGTLALTSDVTTGRVYAGNGLTNVNDSTLKTDTSLTAPKAYVNYKYDIQQVEINGRATFGDVRDIFHDSLFVPNADTTISTNYTLTTHDIGRSIYCTNTSLITVTIPTGLTAGLYQINNRRYNIGIYQEGVGSGLVQVAAGSGMTIKSADNATKTRVETSYLEIHFKADNSVKIVGDII